MAYSWQAVRRLNIIHMLTICRVPKSTSAPDSGRRNGDSRKRKPWLSKSPAEPQPFPLLQSHRYYMAV